MVRKRAQQALGKLLPLQSRLESTISELRTNLKSLDPAVQNDSLIVLSEVIFMLSTSSVVRNIQEALQPILVDFMSSENELVIISAANSVAGFYLKLGEEGINRGLM